MELVEDDPIVPSRIEHRIDDIRIEGRTVQYYNYLDYHFESEAAYFRARAYVDNMRRITLYGPFAGPEDLVRVEAPDMEAAVFAYLERRFRVDRR